MEKCKLVFVRKKFTLAAIYGCSRCLYVWYNTAHVPVVIVVITVAVASGITNDIIDAV